jgi:uncharacterized protein YerC
MKKINDGSKPFMGKAVEKWQEVLWDNLLENLSKIQSKKELKAVLESFLAENEKKIILRRLAAIALIKQGKSYQEIGEILWISPATISAIKKNLSSKSPHHKSHKLIYQKKNHFSAPNNSPKESFSESVLNFISQLMVDAERELSRKGLSLVSYSRSIQSKNKR